MSAEPTDNDSFIAHLVEELGDDMDDSMDGETDHGFTLGITTENRISVPTDSSPSTKNATATNPTSKSEAVSILLADIEADASADQSDSMDSNGSNGKSHEESPRILAENALTEMDTAPRTPDRPVVAIPVSTSSPKLLAASESTTRAALSTEVRANPFDGGAANDVSVAVPSRAFEPVPIEVFERMKNELSRLRIENADVTLKAEDLKKQLYNQQHDGESRRSPATQRTSMSSGTSETKQPQQKESITKKWTGAWNKRFNRDKEKDKDKNSEQIDELAQARQQVSQLQAEIVLHKEMKDQLTADLRVAMCDFEDQRNTFKATIVSLTERNTALLAQLTRHSGSDHDIHPAPDTTAASGPSVGDPDTSAVVTSSDGTNPDGASADALQEATIRIQFLESKCARLADDIQRQNAERDQMRTDLGKATAALNKLEEERNLLRRDIVRLNDELSEQIEQLHEAERANLQAVQFRKNLEERLSDCETALEAEFKRGNEADSEVRSLIQQLSEAEAVVEKLKTEMAGTSAKVQKTEEESTAAVSGLAAANKHLMLQVEESHTARKSADKRIEELTTKLSVSSTEAEGMRASLLDTERQLAALTGAKSVVDHQVAQLEAQTVTQSEDIARLRREVEEEREGRKALEQESRMVVDGNQRVSAALSATEGTLERERSRLATSQADVARLTAELASVTAQKETLCTEVETLRANDISLRAEKDSLLAANTSLTTQADELRAALTTAEAEVAASTTKLEELQSSQAEEVTRLEQSLQDSEQQRKLDQRKNAKSIKDLTRQLQKQQPTPATPHGGASSGAMPSSPNHRRTMSDTIRPDSGATPSSTTTVSSAQRRTAAHPTAAGHARGDDERDAAIAAAAAARLRGAGASPAPKSACAHARACAICVKREKKAAFLQTHNDDLIADLQKKSKIIQTFLLREEKGKIGPTNGRIRPGAPTGSSPPKQNLGTRMASVFQLPGDKHKQEQLELTVEANRKLQLVTEDVLLQNIHLRESLDVLSAENQRLSAQQ
eukprot:m.1459927 g.1459927  ORF g.1459927 m.1459927 type:complete len:1019 (-) comp25129_c0_seq2:3453-6509(-)